MRGLDLRKFKKVATDDKTSTFKNDKGASITISHAGLSKSHLAQLKALPIYHDEGGVQPSVTPTPAPTPTPPPDQQPPQQDTSAPVPHELPPPTADSGTEDASVNEPDSNVPGAGDVVGNQKTSSPELTEGKKGNVDNAIAQGQLGLQQQRDVDSRLAQINEHLDENRIKSQMNITQEFQNNAAQLKQYHEDFLKDYGDGQINPKHYQENMGAGSKVAAAIGLFLGGISSGLTHQGNPALDFINKQIDRDIEAQKAGLNNKMNLYNANLNYFKDQNVALNETRNQLTDVYLSQVKQAADKLGTPAAMARYNQLASELSLKTAGIQQQDAVRKTIMDTINRDGGKGLSPLSLSAAGLVPQEQAVKEADSINKQRDSIKFVNDYFNQMQKLQTVGSRVLSPIESKRQIDALNTGLLNKVLQNSDAKRVTHDSLAAEFEPLTSGFIDGEKSLKTKKDQMLAIISSHAEPTPYTSQIAPGAVPLYPYQTADKLKVGNIVPHNGQNVQIIDQQGHYKPVK